MKQQSLEFWGKKMNLEPSGYNEKIFQIHSLSISHEVTNHSLAYILSKLRWSSCVCTKMLVIFMSQKNPRKYTILIYVYMYMCVSSNTYL